MSKFRDTDYLHISVRLRAVSQNAVDAETLYKMIDSQSSDTAVKLLAEHGYNITDSAADSSDGLQKRVDAALTAELNRAYAFVTSLLGDSPLVSLLKVQYDFMNIKALVKAEMLGIAPDSMLVGSGNIPNDKLIDAYRNRDKALLDGALYAAVGKATEEAASTGDPQRIDLVIDKACYEYIMTRAKRSGFDFLADYFGAKADLTNIMIFIRCRRMAKDLAFFEYSLLPCRGVIRTEKLVGYYSQPLSEFYTMLTATPYSVIFEGAEKEEISAGEFELRISRYFGGLVADMKRISFGPQVVTGYLLSKENEISNIRIAFSAIATGMAPEDAKARLRV